VPVQLVRLLHWWSPVCRVTVGQVAAAANMSVEELENIMKSTERVWARSLEGSFSGDADEQSTLEESLSSQELRAAADGDERGMGVGSFAAGVGLVQMSMSEDEDDLQPDAWETLLDELEPTERTIMQAMMAQDMLALSPLSSGADASAALVSKYSAALHVQAGADTPRRRAGRPRKHAPQQAVQEDAAEPCKVSVALLAADLGVSREQAYIMYARALRKLRLKAPSVLAPTLE